MAAFEALVQPLLGLDTARMSMLLDRNDVTTTHLSSSSTATGTTTTTTTTGTAASSLFGPLLSVAMGFNGEAATESSTRVSQNTSTVSPSMGIAERLANMLSTVTPPLPQTGSAESQPRASALSGTDTAVARNEEEEEDTTGGISAMSEFRFLLQRVNARREGAGSLSDLS